MLVSTHSTNVHQARSYSRILQLEVSQPTWKKQTSIGAICLKRVSAHSDVKQTMIWKMTGSKLETNYVIKLQMWVSSSVQYGVPTILGMQCHTQDSFSMKSVDCWGTPVLRRHPLFSAQCHGTLKPH